ncbi:SDR family NAD(P)-dependent oxidoreductase [Modestobacter sp. SSW1-42]|uniref:SDR family NAD(P)-dependent oxidoreductase n=1 Tax=Modestobacter sp. SSW1-42 TaxID=596372 RepID=UPI003987E84B
MDQQAASEIIVITGAGSGMGRDIAVDQAARGRHAVLVGRRLEPLQETAAAISPALSTVVAADVSTREGAAQVREALAGRPVTGFVANAGGQGDFKDYNGDLEHAEDAWEQALRKNFYSAMLPIEALLPHMVDQLGRIVLIGSTSGLDGRGGPYATAKAALAGYGRELAVRAGARGITANTIAPGFVSDTEFFTSGGFGDSAAFVDQVAAQTLVGRVGAPADVTSAVRWLLGDDAGWVTGQTIVVSGGTDMAR